MHKIFNYSSMKIILTSLMLIFALNTIHAQCKIIYQKSNGHFAYNEDCARKIKRKNGYSEKQMKRIIERELSNARSTSRKQVRQYGRRITNEAKNERNRRWNEERRQEQITRNRRNAQRNYNMTRKQQEEYDYNTRQAYKKDAAKRKRQRRANSRTRTSKAASCGHSASWHRRNGTCASAQ